MNLRDSGTTRISFLSFVFALVCFFESAAQDQGTMQNTDASVVKNLRGLRETWGTRWYSLRQRGQRVGCLSISLQSVKESDDTMRISVSRTQRVGTPWVNYKEEWTVRLNPTLTPIRMVTTFRCKSVRATRTEWSFDAGLARGERTYFDFGGSEVKKSKSLMSRYPEGSISASLMPVLVAALPFENGPRRMTVTQIDEEGDTALYSGEIVYRSVVKLEHGDLGGSELHYFGFMYQESPKDRAWLEHRYYVSPRREFVRRDFDGEPIPEQFQLSSEERATEGIPVKDFE